MRWVETVFSSIITKILGTMILSSTFLQATAEQICISPTVSVNANILRGEIEEPRNALSNQEHLICLGEIDHDRDRQNQFTRKILVKNADNYFQWKTIYYSCREIDDGSHGAQHCFIEEFSSNIKEFISCSVNYADENVACAKIRHDKIQSDKTDSQSI